MDINTEDSRNKQSTESIALDANTERIVTLSPGGGGIDQKFITTSHNTGPIDDVLKGAHVQLCVG